jgi:hypothetical protein
MLRGNYWKIEAGIIFLRREHITHPIKRLNMNFNELAKSVLEPTLLHFDFTLKREIRGLLEYDHKILKISISYDYSLSYELDVTFSFKTTGIFYGYNDMRELFYNQKSSLIATQIKDEDILTNWLADIQSFLKKYLPDLINNHEKICSKLEAIRKQQIDNYEKNRNESILKKEVEKYWASKDYYGLVNYLKGYHGEFEGSIKKKYEYALKMIEKK